MLYRLASGGLLHGIIETLWVRAGPMLRMPFKINSYDPIVFRRGVERHGELLSALRTQDRDAAQQALLRDIADTAQWYHEHFYDGRETQAGK